MEEAGKVGGGLGVPIPGVADGPSGRWNVTPLVGEGATAGTGGGAVPTRCS